MKGIVNAVTSLRRTKEEEASQAPQADPQVLEGCVQSEQNEEAVDESTQRVLERALGAVQMILHCADHEITSRTFILDRIREFGIPYNEWPEMWQFMHWRNVSKFGVMQIPTEFADFLMMLVRMKTIKTAIEIGVWHGASSYLTCAVLQRINPDVEYYMVDVEDHTLGFELFKEHLNLIKHVPATSRDFEGRMFDLVFIDGDHSYGGVQMDYLCLGQHARQVVAFHDIHGHEFNHLDGGPARFWSEFRTTQAASMTVCEFRHSQATWMGIGMGIRSG
ncbi:class I SAM-dependent methyltransferase [Roseomonas sp. SXEYE002]|uniref:class I SAM-dependent methyltransferase n=1 Tax=Roseomonas xinghualingensis TaxID=2986475 RepID=UPI0021F1F4CF|nr:class I SAM-dependent methyltransferase [Roseomonas sp. SXEYE001]MCV4210319.1 class I SAM-dependent methyltransferase [Roseomonas sp. SXEYE001]